MRILIIEDEKRLAETLADILTEHKYETEISNDGEEGLDNALTGVYDAIVLDVMLPKKDGFQIVEQLRENKIYTPVLMLTAKNELEDRLKGLDNGADYYLSKPFEIKELLACLRVILRRGEIIKNDMLSIGDIQLDTSLSMLLCGEKSVRLGAKELELLKLLILNKDMLLPKETIFLKVWGYDSEADDSIVEVYLSFLRRKLENINSKIKIAVARRLGYRLDLEDLN